MAGTVTVTRADTVSRYGKEINKVSVAWTSDASGNATGAIELYGFLVRATTVPSASVAPTTLYDISLVDPDGSACDAAMGLLVDQSATLTVTKYMTVSGSSVPILCAGSYTFTVANAGNAKAGVVYFYLVDDI